MAGTTPTSDLGALRSSTAAAIAGQIQTQVLAEREGFEPPIPLRVCRISSAVLSTTQPPLHVGVERGRGT